MPDEDYIDPDDDIDPIDMYYHERGETLAMLRTCISLLLKPEFRSKASEMMEFSARDDKYTRDLSELIWQQKDLMDRACMVAGRDAYSFDSDAYNMHYHLGEGMSIHVSMPRVSDDLEIQPASITAGSHELSSCRAVYAFLKAYVPITKQFDLLWDILQWYRRFIGREWQYESFHTGILSEDLKPFNELIRQVLDGKQ